MTRITLVIIGKQDNDGSTFLRHAQDVNVIEGETITVEVTAGTEIVHRGVRVLAGFVGTRTEREGA